jgi:hypothetical protein
MEVLKSRFGLDRSIEKLDHETLRVMGESYYTRVSSNKNEETVMFDFEGGPCLTVGGRISYGGIQWKVLGIDPNAPVYDKLSGCTVRVSPIY